MKKSIILFVIWMITLHTVVNGQGFSDRHNTSKSTGWTSCTMSSPPIDLGSNMHWIYYDFGHVYPLHQLHYWNHNHPDELTNGLREIRIYVSIDGENFTNWGDISLNMATGSSFYEGEDAVSLGGINARYMMVQALSNHGGSCYSLGELRIGVAGTVLPIELGSFQVSKIDNKDAQLDWVIASAINAAQIEIQRSQEQQQWTTIATMDMQPEINQSESFEYIDFRAVDFADDQGNLYYRLKMVDLDASIEYSDIRNVQFIENQFRSKVYPNPLRSSEQLNIVFKATKPGNQTISIMNTQGQLMQQIPVVNPGMDEIIGIKVALDPSLPSGNYLVLYGSDNQLLDQFTISN